MTTLATAIAPVITPDALADLLRERHDVRLLDVRTPAEFGSVHIRGAYNVPLDTLGEHSEEISANITTPLVLVCRSGSRARRAEDALKQAGMASLHVLDGGMEAWIAAGQPVRRGEARLSLERQVRIAAGGLAAVGGLLGALVNPLFAVVPAVVGSGLVYAGLTDNCGLALVLAKLPYNRPAGCDVETMVRALKAGVAPTSNIARPAVSVTSCSR